MLCGMHDTKPVIIRRPWRRGSALIETMVAVTLLMVGVLAVASGTASISRMIGEGSRLVRTALVGRSILESALATACTAGAQGDTTVGDLTLRRVVRRRGLLAEIVVVATTPTLPGHGDSLLTARLCPR
jgi:hypothetical protein